MNAPDEFLLRAGVLAAGRGERLRMQSSHLKPLVKVGDQTLIEHVLNSMSEAGASEVVVIINEDSLAVRDHVTASKWPFALRWIVETTPTSMHSFLRLVETLAVDGDDGPFLLSTVDTVADPQTYAQFITEARRHAEAAVTLALTSPGNDDKPLLCDVRRATHALSQSAQRPRLPIRLPQACMRFAGRFSENRIGPARRSRCAANLSRASAGPWLSAHGDSHRSIV